MKNVNLMSSLLSRMIADESGAATIEYALVLGLLVVGTLVVMSNIGTKVLGRWHSVNSSL